ncbi:AraC family transcriptional regulator [Tenacibaculum finnmarkense]|uniref:AraC family transcriptional regulator n=2 Tax=Flavobacteriaceae TaxID=49546 RepID=UPI001EFAF74B|nr:AraC family transcriptional regulator [Tenacibaculum finnmarkense]MCG8796665.1 AraC family transcriptional regulator [Tenacibaculum finnmarkense]MCG8799009.1 AraC family transcriptional regulator [Tenacibaculum finnmarkense]
MQQTIYKSLGNIKEKIEKIKMILDDLEYITIENQTTEFPKHFHETFCISLIHKGIEQIDFENQSLFSEAGSISITNPFEIHSNPLFDRKNQLKFDTIYIPNQLIKDILNGKSIKFTNRKINSKNANRLFLELKNAIDKQETKNIEFYLRQFINTLKTYSQENKKEYSELKLNSFKQINNYIESHIYDKFSLNELSKIANINKFGFAKKFKASTGMSPINYILMKKVFSSKKLINPNTELTTIAYQYNFTDLAHFSNTFKRFVGISPKKYQQSIIEKL